MTAVVVLHSKLAVHAGSPLDVGVYKGLSIAITSLETADTVRRQNVT
jgi:hypothetical protein